MKSYIDPPIKKQTGKREILSSFWDMTFGFKVLVKFSDVTVNIEEILKSKRKNNNKNCIFYVKISSRYKEERWPNISYSGFLITSPRHKYNLLHLQSLVNKFS